MPEETRDNILDELEEFLKEDNRAVCSAFLIALKDLRIEYDGYRNGSFLHINQIARLNEINGGKEDGKDDVSRTGSFSR